MTNFNELSDNLLTQIKNYIDYEINQGVRLDSAIISKIHSDGTVDIYFPPDKNKIFTKIQNQSVYQDLKPGDGVKVIYENGSESSCWIIGKHQGKRTVINENNISLQNLQISSDFPLKMEIINTLFENVRLTKNENTYIFPTPLTLSSDELYYVKYKYFDTNGNLNDSTSFFGFCVYKDEDIKLNQGSSSGVPVNITINSNEIICTSSMANYSEISLYCIKLNIVNYENLALMRKQGTDQAVASGRYSSAEGANTLALGYGSHAEGSNTTASGNYSHAEGARTIASSFEAHAEGYYTTASGGYSHAEGYYTTASGNYSHAEGSHTIASGTSQFVIGRYNIENANSSSIFIVGYGNSDTSRSNVFRVTNTATYGKTYNSSGADYAEYFEWEDNNTNNEDRVGRFVTLNGDKIKLASNEDNFILGIISGDPSIIGDSHDDQWYNMYETDIYGRPIFEEKKLEEIVDENGETLQEEKIEIVRKINPNYDYKLKYIPRSERPEWDAVGMMGKLVLIDDGSCVVNEYCKPSIDGMGTYSKEQTKYRVLKRLDENHIQILIL